MLIFPPVPVVEEEEDDDDDELVKHPALYASTSTTPLTSAWHVLLLFAPAPVVG